MSLMTVHRLNHFYFHILQGQTESKKRSRSVETKGTAMSFGFKKKLLPAHKKNSVADGTKLNDNNQIAQKDDNTFCASDSNGNSG